MPHSTNTPAFIEPEVGIIDPYCPACGWEAGGPDDWGYLTMDERPFAPPEAYEDTRK